MLNIKLAAESSAPAADVLASAREFSRRRTDVWANVSAKGFAVHASGETFAEVTEAALRGVIWERSRYEWSRPDSVRQTVLDSNALMPGSSWEITATPNGGGCHIDVVFLREFKDTPKERLAKWVNRLAGRRLYGWDLRRALAVIESQ